MLRSIYICVQFIIVDNTVNGKWNNWLLQFRILYVQKPKINLVDLNQLTT